MPDRSDLPHGLVFSSSPSAATRRWTFIVVGIVLLAGIALIWPVYPSVSGIEPYVLGVPFSLAWIVGWLGIVFAALVFLYRADDHNSEAED